MLESALYFQLGDTNGVVVQHKASLHPSKLQASLLAYGSISSTNTYILENEDLATVVYFSEAYHNSTCFISLSKLVQHSQIPEIIQVGWLSENSEETFFQKKYVKGRWIATPVPATGSPTSSDGFLIIFWRGSNVMSRMEVVSLAKATAIEVCEDEKEGGRMFMRFPSEDAATDFHSMVASRFVDLKHAISYADAGDFYMAKKARS